VLREGDNNQEEITWEYYDVTTAGKIENRDSPLTRKTVSFPKVERPDYHFQVGQKVGMAVYRNFEVTDEDAGMHMNSISKEELRTIFGQANRVNITRDKLQKSHPVEKPLNTT
jgi:hypothetical protein